MPNWPWATSASGVAARSWIAESGTASPYPADGLRFTLRAPVNPTEDNAMAKGMDKRKEDKKKPEKSLKEKRAAKKEKKAGK